MLNSVNLWTLWFWTTSPHGDTTSDRFKSCWTDIVTMFEARSDHFDYHKRRRKKDVKSSKSTHEAWSNSWKVILKSWMMLASSAAFSFKHPFLLQAELHVSWVCHALIHFCCLQIMVDPLMLKYTGLICWFQSTIESELHSSIVTPKDRHS